MPALNITFSESELEQLRESAAQANTSLKSFVHDSALHAARNRKDLIAQMAHEVARTSAELNRRLA